MYDGYDYSGNRISKLITAVYKVNRQDKTRRAPADERQAAELAYEALVRAADARRAQLGPIGDGGPPGDSSDESFADSDASDPYEEESSSDSESDSDSGDDDGSAESEDRVLVPDYSGAIDDSRFCDRCRAWGHTNNYCSSLPSNKRRRVG